MGRLIRKPKPMNPEGITKRIWLHVSQMLRLAQPIVLTRSGMILLVLVDTIMVGHYDADQLGFLAMGMSVFQPLMVSSIGLIMGTLVLTAHHYGARSFRECGQVARRSVVYSIGLGGIGAFVSFFGETYLTWTGQSLVLAREGGKVMFLLGLGLPGHILFIACSFFLEGVRRPVAGFVAIAMANLVNLILNWVLISGYIDLLPEGAAGAALATSITRWLVAAGMVIYIFFISNLEMFSIREFSGGDWSSWGHQRRLGYASGASMAVETSAFTTVQQFAGWLGPVPLAAFTAAFYLLVASFMVAIGFGAATTVQVANAHGRQDYRNMAVAGWTGLGLTAMATGVIGLFLIIFDESFIRIFTDDTNVIVLALPLVFWAAIALITDGGQAVMSNALRGRQDVWMACFIQATAFIGVMLPLTWYLVFALGEGLTGIFQGILGSTIIAITLMSFRFYWLYRRDLRKNP